MSKSEVTIINVQLDVRNANASAEAILKVLEGLGKTANNIAVQMQNTFDSALSSIELLTEGLETLSECFETVTEWDFSDALTELTEISDTLDAILEKLNEPDCVGIGSFALQGADFMFGSGGLGGNMSRGQKGKFESGKTTLFGGSGGKYAASGKSRVSGIAAGGFGAALGLDALDGDMGDLLGTCQEMPLHPCSQT